jgi:hypothetical protein
MTRSVLPGLAAALVAVGLGLWTLCALWAAPADPPSAEKADETDPLGGNAGCYVCHLTFVKEDLAKVHLKAKVGCTDCHGPSAKHANDENIGATKPDITYKREQVEPSCVKCHEKHNAAARKVIARCVERKLGPKSSPTCTECHGTHKIDRAKEAGAAGKP